MPTLMLGGHSYALADNRNYFINPATTEAYPWAINHDVVGDKGTEKKRTIQSSANTGNVGLIRQQSADDPLVLKREGTVLDATHEKEMWRWFEICKTQTIYFVEFNGDAYEVQVTSYNAQRIGTAAPVRGGPLYYVKYSLEMEVYTVLAGKLAEAGITP